MVFSPALLMTQYGVELFLGRFKIVVEMTGRMAVEMIFEMAVGEAVEKAV
jgi:hypothetical protein